MATLTKKNRAGGREVGYVTIVGIILVVLKLTGNLSWSWWWVLAPFYVPVLFVTLFFIALVIHLVRKQRRESGRY
jgi:hypothetical protein